MNRVAWPALAIAFLAGCGYHVAGRADLLPKTLRKIHIPAFANVTTRYKLTDRLPAAIAREFIGRTRYHVVHKADEADAILTGSVINYFSYPTVYDPVTGRATSVQLSVVVDVKLTERATGVILFHRPVEFRQRYEISVDQTAYFDESEAALERLARDVGRTLVSAILEGF